MSDLLAQVIFAACEAQIFEPDQEEIDFLIAGFHSWYIESEWREVYGSPYLWRFLKAVP